MTGTLQYTGMYIATVVSLCMGVKLIKFVAKIEYTELPNRNAITLNMVNKISNDYAT